MNLLQVQFKCTILTREYTHIQYYSAVQYTVLYCTLSLISCDKQFKLSSVIKC